jgi:hypothetical protein
MYFNYYYYIMFNYKWKVLKQDSSYHNISIYQ